MKKFIIMFLILFCLNANAQLIPRIIHEENSSKVANTLKEKNRSYGPYSILIVILIAMELSTLSLRKPKKEN